MGGRRKSPADDAVLLPVIAQVRTRHRPPANFRLCANSRLVRRSKRHYQLSTHVSSISGLCY